MIKRLGPNRASGAGSRFAKRSRLKPAGFVAACSLLLTACAQDKSPLEQFTGTWVMQFRGQNLMVLRLEPGQGDAGAEQLSGSLTRPRGLQMDGEGSFSGITAEQVERQVLDTNLTAGELWIQSEGDQMPDEMVMTLIDEGRAVARPVGLPDYLPPFFFARAPDGENPVVANDWPEPGPSTPELEALRDRLIAMATADQAVRQEGPVDPAKIEAVDASHSTEVARIFETYGWPGASLVGRDAASAYWLLVQHQDAAFRQKVLPEMEKAVLAGDASRQSFAMLYDRVMHEAGGPQRWGTQADCNNGTAVLAQPVEKPEQLEARRRAIYLPPLDQYLPTLESQCRAAGR